VWVEERGRNPPGPRIILTPRIVLSPMMSKPAMVYVDTALLLYYL
jgi:hypothetical protein